MRKELPRLEDITAEHASGTSGYVKALDDAMERIFEEVRILTKETNNLCDDVSAFTEHASARIGAEIKAIPTASEINGETIFVYNLKIDLCSRHIGLIEDKLRQTYVALMKQFGGKLNDCSKCYLSLVEAIMPFFYAQTELTQLAPLFEPDKNCTNSRLYLILDGNVLETSFLFDKLNERMEDPDAFASSLAFIPSSKPKEYLENAVQYETAVRKDHSGENAYSITNPCSVGLMPELLLSYALPSIAGYHIENGSAGDPQLWKIQLTEMIQSLLVKGINRLSKKINPMLRLENPMVEDETGSEIGQLQRCAGCVDRAGCGEYGALAEKYAPLMQKGGSA